MQRMVVMSINGCLTSRRSTFATELHPVLVQDAGAVEQHERVLVLHIVRQQPRVVQRHHRLLRRLMQVGPAGDEAFKTQLALSPMCMLQHHSLLVTIRCSVPRHETNHAVLSAAAMTFALTNLRPHPQLLAAQITMRRQSSLSRHLESRK